MSSHDDDEEPGAVGGVMQDPTVKKRNRPRRAARGIARSFTVPQKTSDDRAAQRLGYENTPIEYDLDAIRPRTRGECVGAMRPCPWAGCRHHLLLEVSAVTGSLKLNFPGLELEELPATCALDVADRGGITLEEVGVFTNLTRERVRQVEVRAIHNPALAELRKEIAA